MDRVLNPYAPGAGTAPPELAGRDRQLDAVRNALKRVAIGNPAKSLLLVGLRGVGKTVLLDRMKLDAERDDFQTVRIEAPEKRSLPALLTPALRSCLIRLSRNERAKAAATRALKALTGFATALKVTYSDVSVGLDFEAKEPGLADNGDLEHDLQELFDTVGQATQSAGTVLVLFVDELQYVAEDQLAALITALHRVAQQKLPVVLVGAGLPQLRGQMGKAKSYAERLFDFPEIGPLDAEDAAAAIRKPAENLGVEYTQAAVDAIVAETRGYPYFLQEWGKHSWDVADSSPIDEADVRIATESAVAALDESFFRVRFDRLTPGEQRYLHAMARLGPGPHRSGDVASEMKRKVQSLGPTRSALIRKGMVFSPSHGDTAFTVPLFDEFMLRVMANPDEESA